MRRELVAFCDQHGFPQTASDLMIDISKIPHAGYMDWAMNAQSPLGSSVRAQNIQTIQTKIVQLNQAVLTYLYAKEHGVEAAMIWRLSDAS